MNTGMFMNGSGGDIVRPAGQTLPAAAYRYAEPPGRGEISAFLDRYLAGGTLESLIYAILLSAENGYSLYIALPGNAQEASLAAVKLMNIIFPAFPAEYRKKLGFMTFVTETYAYEDISIYFTFGKGLSRQFISGAYCFDLTRDEPYISIPDDDGRSEYSELIRTIAGNIMSYDEPTLSDCFNAIQPKLGEYDKFYLPKISEIFHIWRFLSGSPDDNIDTDEACRVLTSFYDLYSLADNSSAFLERINVYWERETAKCRKGGYSPDIAVFRLVNEQYPTLGENDRLNIQRTWSYIVIYTAMNGLDGLCGDIFSYEYYSSGLARDIFRYALYMYISTARRGDAGDNMHSVLGRVIGYRVKASSDYPDSGAFFEDIGDSVRETGRYCTENPTERGREYEIFSSQLLTFFDEPVSALI